MIDTKKELQRVGSVAWPSDVEVRADKYGVDVLVDGDQVPLRIDAHDSGRHNEAALAALRVLASEPDPRIARVEALVTKWRAEAAKYDPSTVELIAGGVGCLKLCADELESALREFDAGKGGEHGW